MVTREEFITSEKDHLEEVWDTVTAAERERCAKIAEELSGPMIDGKESIEAIVDRIRSGK